MFLYFVFVFLPFAEYVISHCRRLHSDLEGHGVLSWYRRCHATGVDELRVLALQLLVGVDEEEVPEKTFKFVHGGCPTHLRMPIADVERAKAAHPAAKLLVHPECLAEVSKAADYIGSTTGIIDYAKNSTDREFIIGTENSILQHLQYECPEKSFYPLSKDCVCHNMKLTTLMDVYNCVKGAGGEEIILPDDIRTKAKACIDTMLTLGE